MDNLPRIELVAAHVPVLHRGYTDLFNDHPHAIVGVFDIDILNQFDYLRKDIRALTPEIAKEAIQGLGRRAYLLSQVALHTAFLNPEMDIYLPDDDISRELVVAEEAIYANVSLEPVFLRWDRRNVDTEQAVVPDSILKQSQINPVIMLALGDEQQKSRNWWRHVGAALVKNNQVISRSHNQTLPTDHTLYIDGDPRITAHRGSAIEKSIDIHAESSAIAIAAKNGINLEGSDIYVSTFPCPNCAKLITTAGIKTCYFVEGYAMLDGYSVLKSAGVEIIRIEATLSRDASSRDIPYITNKDSQ